MTVYISGPITGNDNAEDEFADAWIYLNNLGYSPVSPISIGYELKEKLKREPTWAEYMREDIKALMDCDGIFLLDRWFDSRGSRMEYMISQEIGIKHIYLD